MIFRWETGDVFPGTEIGGEGGSGAGWISRSGCEEERGGG